MQTLAQQQGSYYEEASFTYENEVLKKGYGSAGFGLGLEYGGLGVRFGYNVADKLNLFTGIGYNLNKVGFNAGLAYDFANINRTSFYVSGMGGYNAVTAVEGAPEYTQTFYGASLGIGLKMETKRTPGNYFQFGLILPMRSQAFRDMMDDIKNDPRVASVSEPWPVLICIGYNAGF